MALYDFIAFCDRAETTEEWLKYATKQICDAVTENINLCDFFIRGIETIYKLQQNTFTCFALLKCKIISCPRLKQEVQNKKKRTDHISLPGSRKSRRLLS